MPAAPMPKNEFERVAALRALNVLDTPAEAAFDHITSVLQAILDVPVALVSLVDSDRQWFKSCIGFDFNATQRERSFCAHVVYADDLIVTEDARNDERFSDNPLVEDPGIRFYAGAPLKTRDGHTIGALCAIDFKPRTLSPVHQQVLEDLAGAVSHLLDLRSADTQLEVARSVVEDQQQRIDLLALVAARTDNAVIITDATGHIVWVNDGFTRMSEYSLDEAKGNTPDALLHGPGTDQQTVAFMRGRVRNGEGFKSEVLNYSKSGRPYWLAVEVQPVHDSDGALTHFLAVESDITDRKEQSQEMAFQKMLLECQTEASLDGILVVDRHRRIVSHNRRFVEMWGIPSDVLTSDDDHRVIQSVLGKLVDPEGFIARAEDVYAHPEDVITDELELCDGRTFERYSDSIIDQDGAYYGRVWYFRDVTEAKRYKQELEQHKLVVENSNAVLFRWRAEEHWPVELVSENVMQFGYSADELLDGEVNFASMVYPDDLERVAEEVKTFVERGDSNFEQEYRLICRNGDVRWIYDRTLIERDAQGNVTHFQGIVIDINDRKLAEARTQQVVNDLEERVKENNTLINVLSLMHNSEASVEETIQNIAACLPAAFQFPQHTKARIRFADQTFSSPGFAPGSDCISSPFECSDGVGGVVQVVVDAADLPRQSDHFIDEERQLLRTVAESLQAYLDRHRIADKLRQHKIVVENSNTVLFRWRVADGWPVELVSENVSQFGYDPADLLSGRVSFVSIVHPDDRDRIEHEILECRRTDGNYLEQEYRIVCSDGEIRWVYDRTTAERDKHGVVTHYQGIIFDITDRRQAEVALRGSEERLRKIAAQVPGAVYQYHWSPDGQRSFPYISDGVYELCGATAEELAEDSSSIMSRILPEDAPSVEASIVESAKSLTRWQSEFRIRHRDGTIRWIGGSSVPQREADGSILWHGLITDITERKQAEQALCEARDEAEAASRAKSEFLANMSHEIRTPLTSILGYAELLRSDDDVASSEQKRDETIDTILRAGRHLTTVINDILDISKIEAGRMTVEQVDTDLPKLMRDISDMMRGRAKDKGIELAIVQDGPLPKIFGADPTRLRQILINLIGNAIKFTEQGKVTVTLSLADEADSRHISVQVRDTGPGMSEQQAINLFMPFFQGDTSVTRRHGGTGLGLAISRRLAGLMGGDVRLRSSDGSTGSCFELTLPVNVSDDVHMLDDLQSAMAEVRASGTAENQLPTLRGRILLAEDGPENQRLIAYHLSKAGADVDVAANGQIALHLIKAAADEHKPYDLLITDVQMPEMDGYTLARTLRSNGSTLPIIALTAHAMTEDCDRCLEAGCNDYASKPIHRATLLKVCNRWMQGEQTVAA